mmetsp:Transcript_19175/g.54150  ORF Transcript_19175/g.54150 Transcript_19175/m.54150 type:complete len:297 (+) Transcript_19175:346-1236(+)
MHKTAEQLHCGDASRLGFECRDHHGEHRLQPVGHAERRLAGLRRYALAEHGDVARRQALGIPVPRRGRALHGLLRAVEHGAQHLRAGRPEGAEAPGHGGELPGGELAQPGVQRLEEGARQQLRALGGRRRAAERVQQQRRGLGVEGAEAELQRALGDGAAQQHPLRERGGAAAEAPGRARAVQGREVPLPLLEAAREGLVELREAPAASGHPVCRRRDGGPRHGVRHLLQTDQKLVPQLCMRESSSGHGQSERAQVIRMLAGVTLQTPLELAGECPAQVHRSGGLREQLATEESPR